MDGRLVRSGFLAAAVVACTAMAPLARAEDCPPTPTDSTERRSEAKRFFDRAQVAQQVGRDSDALADYTCSFRMVRHPFTAFNLAKLAEKIGDNELAVTSLKAYLDLAPEADDREQVKHEIALLQERIDAIERNPNIQAIERERPLGGAAKAGPPPPPPKTDLVAAATPVDDGARTRRIAGWSTLGAGLALVGGGVALNLMARDKMNTCRDLWDSNRPAAVTACDSARPRAYLSYGTLGLGTAAAIAGIIMLGWNAFGSAPAAEATSTAHLGFLPRLDGGLVTLGGAFP